MSGGVDTGGLATALAMMGVKGDAPADDAEQLAMFEADGAMPSMFSNPPPAKSGDKVGRPKGARNKSTEAWRELFLSRYRHPMMVLGEMYSRTPEDLARELGLYKFHEGKLVVAPVLDGNGVQQVDADGNKRWQPVLATGEAADMQQKAAIALLPYLAQKLPLAIESKTDQRGLLVVGDLNVQLNAAGEHQLPLADPPIDITPEKAE